jgi:hypothetical protein
VDGRELIAVLSWAISVIGQPGRNPIPLDDATYIMERRKSTTSGSSHRSGKRTSSVELSKVALHLGISQTEGRNAFGERGLGQTIQVADNVSTSCINRS